MPSQHRASTDTLILCHNASFAACSANLLDLLRSYTKGHAREKSFLLTLFFTVLLLFIVFGVIAVIFKKSNKARKESTQLSAEDTDKIYNISGPAANNRNDESMYPANTAEGKKIQVVS